MAMSSQVLTSSGPLPKREALRGAFLGLSTFYFVYCARPEDWIGLKYVPLAKLAVGAAILGLVLSAGKTERSLKKLPREAKYLLTMIALLFVSALLSPVWRGGAFFRTLDFAKVWLIWTLTFLLVTTLDRLRHIIFIQAVSVAWITLISIVKGHDMPRLEGVIGGIYANPNDLAFAVVLSFPFCLAFLVTTRSFLRKGAWVLAMLVMLTALFLTASRAGFIDLVVAGVVCLWHFGVRGRRFYLIAAASLAVVLLLATAGGPLISRFWALSGEEQNKAYGSYEARKFLMIKALEGIEHYPILGLGAHNFVTYSTVWHEVHMTYLQIAVEGGIPALVIYLMFFYRGFANLKWLRRRKDLDSETKVFVGALHSSLVGFVVGALFAPEVYQFFPYFAVAYTSVLVAMVKERDQAAVSAAESLGALRRHSAIYAQNGGSGAYAVVR